MGYSTWGQLRMILAQTRPGVSLDLIDQSLNSRYARVLDSTRWLGLEASGFVQTTTPYKSSTDTIRVTNGSTAVVGNGTTWASNLTGVKLGVVSDGVIYTFTWVDATHATLDRPYEGTTATAAGYSLFTNIYPLPVDFKELLGDGVVSPYDGYPLSVLTESQLDQSAGFRNCIGEPEAVTISVSPNSLDGASTWQMEFFPVPQSAAGYPLRYVRVAAAFDGTNTSSAPAMFVTDGVLLAGVRADLWAGDNPNKAQMYEAQFAAELVTMIKADRRKRPPEIIRPSRSQTQHRLERWARGYRTQVLP